ncbi:MAG: phosphatase PAP2 family protein [Saprospiraceae bacterium]|nr:phosphatase PAP2 family protein [Saprospiraceae bacterium]
MNKITYTYRIALSLGLLFSLSYCDKNIDSPAYEFYPETSLDAGAANWKTYILANGAEIAVPAPEAAASAAYQAELADLKAKMGAATSQQQELARHWGANGVMRWHAIARELAANYNVPPNYNADGTYPAPNPMDPTTYPRFPFANPPYASRAFALLAVAQYDALVTAWRAKFEHNRLAPYKNDASIQPLIPTNDLPSYPSEDAVVAAASREVLKFLFPGEVQYLTDLASEHKNSRLWAGANVQSDLDAGEALGAAVAARIIDYAKTDRMGMANNQAAFANLRADAESRGITNQWHSLDVPARAPMLPFFGNVKTWNLDQATMISLRLPPPPQPGSPEFERNIEELRQMSKNRTREQFRITTYWADGVGTYTPPGHWNRRAAQLIHEKQLNEIRAARVMALMCTAVQDAGIACWDVKFYYLLPRPTEVDRNITTATGIPNFPAYASGHSTFSAAAAEVLAYLFPDHATDLKAMAREAAESRIYGCIHYRFDSEDGLEHGKKIGQFAVLRAQTDGGE